MEQFVPVDGGQLWTDAEGTGVPVVFISGGPGCCDYLEPVAGMLDGVARTVRFDARGCGRSTVLETYTLDGTMADLEAIREHYGFEQWMLVGHSAGADQALAYALRFPERTRAIMCLSGGRVHNDREWHAAYSAGRDAGLEAPIAYAFEANMEVNRQLNAEWRAFCKRPGLLRDIASLNTPALFVYGDKDIRPHWPIQQVATLLPRAEWHLVEGATHNLWLDDPEELRGLLREFVGRNPAR